MFKSMKTFEKWVWNKESVPADISPNLEQADGKKVKGNGSFVSERTNDYDTMSKQFDFKVLEKKIKSLK